MTPAQNPLPANPADACVKVYSRTSDGAVSVSIVSAARAHALIAHEPHRHALDLDLFEPWPAPAAYGNHGAAR